MVSITNQPRFERLIQEALAQEFSGWDFAYLDGRMLGGDPTWDYAAIVQEHLPDVQALLDCDTGGGELLSSLAPRPPLTAATEGYPPNVKVAGQRLLPLGIHLVDAVDSAHLPFANGAFDLIINRHGDYNPHEVFRLLSPGGRFITQQVGGRDEVLLNRALEDEISFVYYDEFGLEKMQQEFEDAGFHILDLHEAFPETRYTDIGAVVFYLKVISWQVPDFTVKKYYDRLAAIHNQIETNGFFPSRSHRLLLQAVRP
jgi:SAM-dependent methyltransferase